MNRITAFNPGRIAIMALYVVGAWAALAGLMFAATWEPAETWGQSARVIALVGAALALLMCVLARLRDCCRRLPRLCPIRRRSPNRKPRSTRRPT